MLKFYIEKIGESGDEASIIYTVMLIHVMLMLMQYIPGVRNELPLELALPMGRSPLLLPPWLGSM